MSIWHTALVDMRSTAPAVMSPPAQRGHRHKTASVPRRDRDMSDSYRREVAILFACITGFTQLAETLDPEVVYLRVSPLLDALVPPNGFHVAGTGIVRLHANYWLA